MYWYQRRRATNVVEQSQQIKNNLIKLIRLTCKEMHDTLSNREV